MPCTDNAQLAPRWCNASFLGGAQVVLLWCRPYADGWPVVGRRGIRGEKVGHGWPMDGAQEVRTWSFAGRQVVQWW